jgi:hypothetical protein
VSPAAGPAARRGFEAEALADVPDAAGFAPGLAAGFEPAVADPDVVRVVRRAAVVRRVEAGLVVFAPFAGAAEVPSGAADAAVDPVEDRDAAGFRPVGLAAVALAVDTAAADDGVAVGFLVVAGFAADDAVLRRVVVVAAAAVCFGAAALSAGFFATGFLAAGFGAAVLARVAVRVVRVVDRLVAARRVAGFVVVAADDAGGVTGVRTGVTAWPAWAAAEPTRRAAADAAPVTLPAAADAAPVTVPTAEPAAEVARAATCAASDATSLSAAAACRRRLVTCFRPFVPRATAS